MAILPENWADGNIYSAGSLNAQNDETNKSVRIITSLTGGGSVVNSSASVVLGSLVAAAGEFNVQDSWRVTAWFQGSGTNNGIVFSSTLQLSGAASSFGANISVGASPSVDMATPDSLAVIYLDMGSGAYIGNGTPTKSMTMVGSANVDTENPKFMYMGMLSHATGNLNSGGVFLISASTGSVATDQRTVFLNRAWLERIPL